MSVLGLRYFFQLNKDAPIKVHDRFWYKADAELWLQSLVVPKSALNKKNMAMISDAANRLSLIHDGDLVVGRAAISVIPGTFIDPLKEGSTKHLRDDLILGGHLTYGGISSENPRFITSATNVFFGLIDGRPNHANRFGPPMLLQWNLGGLFQYPEQRQKWVKEQIIKLQDKDLNKEQANALRENLARFGQIQPGYFTFRIFELGVTYEKLSDMPVRSILDIGESEDQFEIHLPTLRARTKEQFQTFISFDRKDIKLLSRVLTEIDLAKLYFPMAQDKSQVLVPRDLSNRDEFSGIFGSLIMSLEERGFHVDLSVNAIPRPKGLDNASNKLFNGTLFRLVTVKGRKA